MIAERTSGAVLGSLMLLLSILVLTLFRFGSWVSTVVASLQIGFGTSVFTIRIGCLISGQKAADPLMLTAISLVVGSIISLLVSSLDALLAYVVMASLPLLLGYFCITASRRCLTVDEDISMDSQVVGVFSRTRGFKGLFLSAVVIMGLSIGLIRISVGPGVTSQAGVYVFHGMVALAGVFLCASRVASQKSLFLLAFFGIVVGVLSALSLLLQNRYFSYAIHTLSFTYFNGVFWMIAVEISRRSTDSTKMFSLIELTMQVGFIIGCFVGLLPPFSSGAGAHGGIAALIAGYVVLVAAVLVLARIGIQGSVAMDEGEINFACRAITKDFSLTKRESEILELLCFGCTRSYIAEKLAVSSETVKTHVSHIYAKLDLHSRQDLAKLLERYAFNVRAG